MATCTRYRGKPNQVGLVMVGRPARLQPHPCSTPTQVTIMLRPSLALPCAPLHPAALRRRALLLCSAAGLTCKPQVSSNQGLLVRKSFDNRGATFVGLLADKHNPETHFKFHMFFCKTGPGSLAVLPPPSVIAARAARGPSPNCPATPSLNAPRLDDAQSGAAGHVPFEGPEADEGVTIPDDLFSEDQVEGV